MKRSRLSSRVSASGRADILSTDGRPTLGSRRKSSSINAKDDVVHGDITRDYEAGATDSANDDHSMNAQHPFQDLADPFKNVIHEPEHSTDGDSATTDRATQGDASDPEDESWRTYFPAAPDRSDNAEIWRTYVKQADEHDTELFERWNGKVDVFLIFTGLFSAILSAFLIASWPLLQPDNTQATVDGIAAMSQQLVLLSSGQPINPSTAYVQEDFVVPWWAVAVNGLWFASLFLSLFAAVIAMLVKEWLSAYRSQVSRVPLERVKQRQFRYQGLNRWMLPSIIVFLPLSIQLAVFLFLLGLIGFAWPVSQVLSELMILLLFFGFSLYMASVLAAILSPDCPFKSSLFTAFRFGTQITHLATAGVRRLFQVASGSADPERGGPARHPIRHWYASVERKSIEQIGMALQGNALAWLVSSPEPESQSTALAFFAWWRAPAAVWEKVRSKVEAASVSFVRGHWHALLQKTIPEDELSKELEKAAIISCLLPDSLPPLSASTLDLYYLVNSLDPYPKSLLLSLLANWDRQNTSARFQSRHEHDSLFWFCTRLETCFNRVHSSPSGMDECIQSLDNLGKYIARTNVSRMFLFKYLSLLTKALGVNHTDSALSSKGEIQDWDLRYVKEVGRSLAPLLFDCLGRLFSEVRLGPPWSSRAEVRPDGIRHALLVHLIRNPDMLKSLPFRSEEIVRMVTLRALPPKTPYTWSVAEVITPLLLARLKQSSPAYFSSNCMEDLILALRWVNKVPAEGRLFVTTFEECIHPFWVIHRKVNQHGAEEFIRDGGMVELLPTPRNRNTALCLPAIVVAWLGLTSCADKIRQTHLVKQMSLAGWSRYMSRFGIRYLLSQYPKHHEQRDADALITMFDDCLLLIKTLLPRDAETIELFQEYFGQKWIRNRQQKVQLPRTPNTADFGTLAQSAQFPNKSRPPFSMARVSYGIMAVNRLSRPLGSPTRTRYRSSNLTDKPVPIRAQEIEDVFGRIQEERKVPAPVRPIVHLTQRTSDYERNKKRGHTDEDRVEDEKLEDGEDFEQQPRSNDFEEQPRTKKARK